MKGIMTVIQPDGSTTKTEFEGSTPNITVLQKAVGGYIETIPFFDTFDRVRAVAVCNEDGKLLGLVPNRLAQGLWEAACRIPITQDYLVGPIAILTGDDEFLESL